MGDEKGEGEKREGGTGRMREWERTEEQRRKEDEEEGKGLEVIRENRERSRESERKRRTRRTERKKERKLEKKTKMLHDRNRKIKKEDARDERK